MAPAATRPIVSRALARRHESERRRKVLYGILGVLALHIAEIWLFGLVYWGLAMQPGTGAVVGADPLALLDRALQQLPPDLKAQA